MHFVHFNWNLHYKCVGLNLAVGYLDMEVQSSQAKYQKVSNRGLAYGRKQFLELQQ